MSWFISTWIAKICFKINIFDLNMIFFIIGTRSPGFEVQQNGAMWSKNKKTHFNQVMSHIWSNSHLTDDWLLDFRKKHLNTYFFLTQNGTFFYHNYFIIIIWFNKTDALPFYLLNPLLLVINTKWFCTVSQKEKTPRNTQKEKKDPQTSN